ncbi:DUF3820 family protein [Fulvivirga lutea]|nr:DUF3820 family protein [Fulvivirga lutea]
MEDAFDPVKARQELEELMRYRMPFGKFKNTRLVELPVEYLIWFKRKGFPAGKLGRYLQIVLSQKGG